MRPQPHTAVSTANNPSALFVSFKYPFQDLVQSVPVESSPAADSAYEVSPSRASADGSCDLQPTQEREPSARDGTGSDSEADIITSQNSLWERLELLQPKTRAVRSVDVVIRNAKDVFSGMAISMVTSGNAFSSCRSARIAWCICISSMMFFTCSQSSCARRQERQ